MDFYCQLIPDHVATDLLILQESLNPSAARSPVVSMAILQAHPVRELSHQAIPGLIGAERALVTPPGLRVRAPSKEPRLDSWSWLSTGLTSAQVGQYWITVAGSVMLHMEAQPVAMGTWGSIGSFPG